MDQCDKIEITKKRPQTKWSYCKIVVLSILQSAVGRSVTAPTETNTEQLRIRYLVLVTAKSQTTVFVVRLQSFFNNMGLLIFSTADMQHEILLGSYSLMQMTRTCILHVSFDTILPTTGVSATSYAGCWTAFMETHIYLDWISCDKQLFCFRSLCYLSVLVS